MSAQDPIRVFVAHTFAEHPDYLRVFEYLESRENFFYENCSRPESIPAGGGTDALKEELLAQISGAEVLVLPVAIYDANRDLAGYQLDVAAARGIPVVAIKSFGDTIALQKTVLERSAEIVEWNERTIIDAIRRQARHEDTARWDVVEFKLD